MKTLDLKPFQSINCRGKLIDLTSPKLMGILNVTPDSFSDGGKYNDQKSAMQQAEKMINEGATFIDLGAQSTRPNAKLLTANEEIQRIGKLISMLKREFPEILISLDTFYSEVVKFGWQEGMDLVNDISGGNYDPKMFETVGESGLPYVLMHVNPHYEKMHHQLMKGPILVEMNYYFSEKINELYRFGVKDILLDPGIGFGKTVEQNHQLIEELPMLNFGNLPLLVGVSKKSFIYKPLGKTPNEVNAETQEIHLKLLKNGAKILRVHEVAEAKKTIERFREFC